MTERQRLMKRTEVSVNEFTEWIKGLPREDDNQSYVKVQDKTAYFSDESTGTQYWDEMTGALDFFRGLYGIHGFEWGPETIILRDTKSLGNCERLAELLHRWYEVHEAGEDGALWPWDVMKLTNDEAIDFVASIPLDGFRLLRAFIEEPS